MPLPSRATRGPLTTRRLYGETSAFPDQETRPMSATHSELVREFCQSLAEGDMSRSRRFLHDDVYYHNQPWSPVTGAAQVCEFLQPFIDGTHCALREMHILYQVCEGEVVMNAREELWVRGHLKVMLPVAGLFVVVDDAITRWVDYWDLATFKPILDDLVR